MNIKEIRGINVSSPYFSNPTDLMFFPKDPKDKYYYRLALVYGKNGTGKSTISNLISSYPNFETDSSLHFLSDDAILVDKDYLKGDNIYVYNEEYVERSVKLQKNGLNNIVLIGDLVSYEKELKGKEVLKESLITALDALKKKKDEFENPSNISSPVYWKKEIEKTLKNDNGWADRDRIIKGNSIKSKVTDTIIDKIMSEKPKKEKDVLEMDFKTLLEIFLKTNTANTVISKINFSIPINMNFLDEVKSLLARNVEKPSVTERESELLKLFGITELANAKDFLTDTSNNFCPHCLQPISVEYREEKIKEINKIINKTVDDYKEELSRLVLPVLDIDTFFSYREVSAVKYEIIQNKIANINSQILLHNSAINKKMDDPYSNVDYPEKIDIYLAYKELLNLLKEIEIDIDSYNLSITKRNQTLIDLQKLNNEIAFFEIFDNYKKYTTQFGIQSKIYTDIASANEQLSNVESDIIYIKAKSENVDIAVDEINSNLSYIFCDDKRLVLELGQDKLYHLKSRGKNVEPSKISIGERNALALSYFFIDIAKQNNKNNLYSKEMLIVIDDPVSSFDIDNRIGIVSLLRQKASEIIKANYDTKVLIMTHDLKVCYDLSLALGEISDEHKGSHHKANLRTFQLENKSISNLNPDKYNEYDSLMNRIYQFAINPSFDHELDIGNNMRKVLEAFSTFSFKKSSSAVSTDPEVLKNLCSKKAQTYFNSRMYRLILDGESHTKNTAQMQPNTDFFTSLNIDEKRQTAEDVLVFMYLLNKQHVLSHIDSSDAESNLEQWSKIYIENE